jgi:putative (di)nucleoside polyphosphate hydrolase
MAKRYRPNVAAILQRADGKVLIARRSDYPESWQFPQGGVGKKESAEEALRREVCEEVALPPEVYRIEATRGGYRYDFPSGPDRRGFAGQEQTYFLCLLEPGTEKLVDPSRGCGEFTESSWVEVNAFPYHLVPPMKQEVYRKVLKDFFGAESESH